MKRIIAVLLTLMMALSLDGSAAATTTPKWRAPGNGIATHGTVPEGVNQGAGMDLATDATMEMVLC